MKKIKSLSRLLLAMAICFSVSVQSIKAESVATEEETFTVIVDNCMYEFDSYNSYLRYIDSSHRESRTSSGTDYVSTQLWSEVKSYQWIGYHPYTTSWNKADGYTITSGKSYSVTGSIESHGIEIGVTISLNDTVAVHYPADPSRYSKLGVYADVRAARYKYDVYEYGVYQYTYYVNSATPVQKYITVVYK